MHNITAHELALQVNKVRTLQKAYMLQKRVLATNGTKGAAIAAGRTIMQANKEAIVLDDMVEQVLLAGKEAAA